MQKRGPSPPRQEDLQTHFTWHIQSRHICLHLEVVKEWTGFGSSVFCKASKWGKSAETPEGQRLWGPSWRAVVCALHVWSGGFGYPPRLPPSVRYMASEHSVTNLVSCQLTQLVHWGENKVWAVPHHCPSSALGLLRDTVKEVVALLLCNYTPHSPSLNIALHKLLLVLFTEERHSLGWNKPPNSKIRWTWGRFCCPGALAAGQVLGVSVAFSFCTPRSLFPQ